MLSSLGDYQHPLLSFFRKILPQKYIFSIKKKQKMAEKKKMNEEEKPVTMDGLKYA